MIQVIVGQGGHLDRTRRAIAAGVDQVRLDLQYLPDELQKAVIEAIREAHLTGDRIVAVQANPIEAVKLPPLPDGTPAPPPPPPPLVQVISGGG